MLSDMLDALRGYLPQSILGLPAPSLAAIEVAERAVGLGQRRGNETRGGFTVVALKGGRLEAIVRFQLWDNQPDTLETAITTLRNNLLADKSVLRSQGFLQMEVAEMSLPERNAALAVWSSTIDYKILYEFHSEDTEGADSLIARIPIHINNGFNESTLVTDRLVRWDDQATPDLEVQGANFPIGTLWILAFLPSGWDGNTVTVSVTTRTTQQEKIFTSVRDFFNAFTLERDASTLQPKTTVLGNNNYQGGHRRFPNPDFPISIILQGEDIFRIRYNDTAFDSNAVVYLRVLN